MIITQKTASGETATVQRRECMNLEKDCSKKRIETIVSVFVTAYGLHYLGYFLRLRYFNLIGASRLSEGVAHGFTYLGHILFLVMLLLYALAVEKDRKYILAFIPQKGKKNLRWFLLGAVTGLALMGISILAANLHGDISVGRGSGAGAGLFIFGFIAVFIQASVEEIESRAFVFGKMKGEGVPLVAAILVSAFFFSYLHATNPGFGIVPLLSIFIVGIQYALAYHYFGNLWFTCGAHTLWNFSQDFIFGLPDSGKPAAVSIFGTTVNGSSFFYDSTFGIEGGWMAICLNAAFCAVLIIIGRKHASSADSIKGQDC